MKQCANTKCRKYKDYSEFNKDRKCKDGLSPRCKECRVEDRKRNREKNSNYQKEYRNNNKKRISEYSKDYRKKNKESISLQRYSHSKKNRERLLATGRDIYHKNKHSISIKKKAYREKNKNKIAEKKLKYNKSNPGKVNARNARHRAAKLAATPLWLTNEHHKQIQDMYIDAARLTRETGIKHHVDHIRPLQGENECGLHVPWNLQILTAEENIRKKNRV